MPTQTLSQGRLVTARSAGVRAPWWREYSRPHAAFQVVTRDSVEIRGVHFNHDHPTLFVYCHGFSSGKNILHITRMVEGFADEMDTLAFDFRGHGESGGETTFGELELLDLDAVIEYAKQFHYQRIVVMGSSMGGAVTIRYAADSPVVDAVITMGAFAHKRFSGMAMAGLHVLQWSVSRRVIHRTTPTRIHRAVPPYNPRDFVARISPRPLLVIHGSYDPLIPLSHAHELYINAREPKTLHVIRRGGHDLENLNSTMRRYILEWIAGT